MLYAVLHGKEMCLYEPTLSAKYRLCCLMPSGLGVRLAALWRVMFPTLCWFIMYILYALSLVLPASSWELSKPGGRLEDILHFDATWIKKLTMMCWSFTSILKLFIMLFFILQVVYSHINSLVLTEQTGEFALIIRWNYIMTAPYVHSLIHTYVQTQTELTIFNLILTKEFPLAPEKDAWGLRKLIYGTIIISLHYLCTFLQTLMANLQISITLFQTNSDV